MKIVSVERLVDAGGFSSTPAWAEIQEQVVAAIRAVDWPPGSGSFTLRDESGKKRGQGSGVTPIKTAFVAKLREFGWSAETPGSRSRPGGPGPMDATCRVGSKLFCAEWETGNVSSSHRALNKIALGILEAVLIGGVLIVPTRAMYRYLTDRVGNFSELEPYFPVWRALRPAEGLLIIMAIEHDAVSPSAPRIPKGTDGRALL